MAESVWDQIFAANSLSELEMSSVYDGDFYYETEDMLDTINTSREIRMILAHAVGTRI